MECAIPQRALKLFGRMVSCLSKVAEDMMQLTGVNTTLTAFYSFSLEPGYFDPYNPNDPTKTVVAKVLLKPCAAIFRSLQSVERCIIRLQEDDPMLVFEMECKYNARRVYKFNVEEAVLNCAVYDKINAGLHVTIKPKSLTDALNNFSASQEEIRWIYDPQSVTVESHFNQVRVQASELKNRAPVSLRLDCKDFESYELGGMRKVDYTMSLHDMRPALTFAEHAATPVSFTTVYDVKKPIVMSVSMANIFTADFVFATCGDLKVDDGAGSEPSSASALAGNISTSQNHPISSSGASRTYQMSSQQSLSAAAGGIQSSSSYGQPHAASSGMAASSWAPAADDARFGGVHSPVAAAPPRTGRSSTPHPGPAFGAYGNTQEWQGSHESADLPAAKRRKLNDDGNSSDYDRMDLEEGDVPDSQDES